VRIASPTVGAHLCRSIVLKVSTKVTKNLVRSKSKVRKWFCEKAYYYFSIFKISSEEKNSEDETENCVKNLCEILTQNSILGRYT
jgi:hypothetical protein